MLKKMLFVAGATAGAMLVAAPASAADLDPDLKKLVSVNTLDACVDTDLAHYVNNYGVCEGGSWVSVRIGATCVNTYADDFRC